MVGKKSIPIPPIEEVRKKFSGSRAKESYNHSAMSKRSFPDRPWLGVGGLVFQDNRVLLVKRGKEPGLGQWSIPGGIVEVGETVKSAVRREIEEETGLQVEVSELVEVFERILSNPQGRVRYHYVVLDYLCRRTGGRLKASSDAAEAGFFPLPQLGLLNLLPETEQVIDKAYKSHQNYCLTNDKKEEKNR